MHTPRRRAGLRARTDHTERKQTNKAERSQQRQRTPERRKQMGPVLGFVARIRSPFICILLKSVDVAFFQDLINGIHVHLEHSLAGTPGQKYNPSSCACIGVRVQHVCTFPT